MKMFYLIPQSDITEIFQNKNIGEADNFQKKNILENNVLSPIVKNELFNRINIMNKNIDEKSNTTPINVNMKNNEIKQSMDSLEKKKMKSMNHFKVRIH